eukprot:scaffold10191_cov84-Skeletonema_marinoi.AAC.1
MVAVSAESAMAMLFIGGANAVMSLVDVVNGLGSAWSEVVVVLASQAVVQMLSCVSSSWAQRLEWCHH